MSDRDTLRVMNKILQDGVFMDAALFAASWQRMVLIAAMNDAVLQAIVDKPVRGWSRTDMAMQHVLTAAFAINNDLAKEDDNG